MNMPMENITIKNLMAIKMKAIINGIMAIQTINEITGMDIITTIGLMIVTDMDTIITGNIRGTGMNTTITGAT
ncbi:MAG: hypothetical protein ABFR31_05760 [Thermodesulfobacteriota bacterium]